MSSKTRALPDSGEAGHIIAALAEGIDELSVQEPISDRKRLRIFEDFEERPLLNVPKRDSSLFVETTGHHSAIDQDAKMISKSIAGSVFSQLGERRIGPNEFCVEMHIQAVLDSKTFLGPNIGGVGKLYLKMAFDLFSDECI